MDDKHTSTLKAEHEALRAALKRGMREEGRTGELARKLAAVADGHFLLEEKFVLPLLDMLPALAAGEHGAAVAEAGTLAAGLKAQIGRMQAEHRDMAAALRELTRAAEAEGKGEYVTFAEELLFHARTEEQVLYPAALVVGEYVNLLRAGKR